MIKLYHQNDFEGKTEITYSFNDSDLGEVLKHFTYFLRALSYSLDGLVVADPEEDIVLTPEEYREALNNESARAIEDYIESRAGWIPWEGSAEAPVHGDTVVKVRLRDGDEDGPGEARYWHWNHIDEHEDVVAYRVIEPERSGCYSEEEIDNAICNIGLREVTAREVIDELRRTRGQV